MDRYRRLADALRDRFGRTVHKVPLRAGFTCPNRDGRLARGGCIYCVDPDADPSGSRTGDDIEVQVRMGIDRLRPRTRAEGFIAYFQSNTNTYLPEVWEEGADPAGGPSPRCTRALDRLESLLRRAGGVAGVVGLAVGTRPDCVQEPILDVLESVARDIPVWVELGLQSVHDRTLALINRRHTYADFLSAVTRTSGRGIPVVVHIILGLPDETREDMLRTARVLSRLPVSGIKIHSLHAVKGTALERWHTEGRWTPMTLEGYAHLVAEVLEVLPPGMVIHRLTAESPSGMIAAPAWCGDKHAVLRRIRGVLEEKDTYQGRLYGI